MAKHGGLYDESPMLKRSEAGHMKVEKPSAKDKGDHFTDEGVKDEGYPVHARHAHERNTMHAKHEHEHRLHEHHHGMTGKEEMHARQESEVKSMHTRHEKEAGAKGGKEAGAGGATGEPIDKIEKNAKS